MAANYKFHRPLPITASQVKLIHVMLHRHGISDDDYRAALEEKYQVNTCKKLTARQANEFLNCLKPGKKRKPKPAAKPAGNVTALATPEQRRLIQNLIDEISWRVQPPADGFAAWLQNNQSLDKVRTTAEASRVIRGLKALKTHQQKVNG